MKKAVCFEKKEDIKKNQRDALEEMAKLPLQVMPLPKPKTVIEFEFSQDYWELEQILKATKKICEEIDGKRDIYIRFQGGLKYLE